MGYRIAKNYKNRAALITNIGDEAVNLLGVDVKKIVAATKKSVEKTVIIRGAKQDDLKIVFEMGSDCVEKFDEPPAKVNA